MYLIAEYKASHCCKIEAAMQRCSVKKVFLKILQNSQENPHVFDYFSRGLIFINRSLTSFNSGKYLQI